MSSRPRVAAVITAPVTKEVVFRPFVGRRVRRRGAGRGGRWHWFVMGVSLLLVIGALIVHTSKGKDSTDTTRSSRPSYPQSKQLKMFLYETNVRDDTAADHLASQAHKVGLDAVIVGSGSEFKGFGSKYRVMKPMLKALDPDVLVVIADARDVILNVDTIHPDASVASDFVETFHTLTDEKPGMVVISAEASCCVGALTYIKPGDLFDATTGKRAARACYSGKPGCTWNGDENRFPWEGFMVSLAEIRTGRERVRDAYLNAGLMAGRASSLLRMIDVMDIQEEEDDQAVLTDLLHHTPDMIRLDYGQELFGNTRHGDGSAKGMEHGCVFRRNDATNTVEHTTFGTRPLFVHNPGQYWECHDKLTRALRQKVVTHDRRHPLNYGPESGAVEARRIPSALLVVLSLVVTFVACL